MLNKKESIENKDLSLEEVSTNIIESNQLASNDDWVFIDGNKVMTDSRIIAKVFNRQHKNIIRAIENNIKNKEKLNLKKGKRVDRLIFEPNTYLDSRGREQKYYKLNREAFSITVFGFTGLKAFEFKNDFINRFVDMEEFILNQSKSIYDDLQIEYRARDLSFSRASYGAKDMRRHQLEMKGRDERIALLESKVQLLLPF